MDERQSERVPQARRIRARAEEDRLELSAHQRGWESRHAQREPGHDSGDRAESPVMRLQGGAGNRAVAGLIAGRRGSGLRPATIQASLSVGSAGDRFEQEAESVANRVVSGAEPGKASAAPVASSTPGVQRSFLDDLLGGGGGGGLGGMLGGGGLSGLLGGGGGGLSGLLGGGSGEGFSGAVGGILGGSRGGGIGGMLGDVPVLGGMMGGETGYSVDGGGGGAGYGVGGLGGELGGAAGSASGGIGGLLSGARNRFREFGQGVWDRVLPGTREPVTEAWDTARDVASGARSRVREFGQGVWDRVLPGTRQPVTQARDTARDLVRGAGEWAGDRAEDAWRGISGAGEAVGEWASDTAGDVWRGVSGAGEAAGQWASDTAGDVWDQVSDAGSGVGSWAAGLFGGDEEELQMSRSDSATGAGFDVAPAIERQLARSEGTGTALAPETRAFMEPRFGADFSGVRIHADADAAQISRELTAEAFTHGRDIYMADGRYSPETDDGKHLLAHELTHVVQQTGAKA